MFHFTTVSRGVKGGNSNEKQYAVKYEKLDNDIDECTVLICTRMYRRSASGIAVLQTRYVYRVCTYICTYIYDSYLTALRPRFKRTLFESISKNNLDLKGQLGKDVCPLYALAAAAAAPATGV